MSRPFPRDIRWDQRDVALAFGTALAIFIGSTLLLVLLFGGDESDDFLKDETFGGVPVGLWIVAVQQIIFVFAAWRFSVSKYRLDVRVLGSFAQKAGFRIYWRLVDGSSHCLQSSSGS